jgi:small subunit ribosomal protein S21
MVFVKAQPGDTSDSVIRKFTKKVINEGLLLEFKKKEFYQKPAEVRKEQKKEIARRERAKRRNRRRLT